MVDRPTLNQAVSGTKNKPSAYNQNFEKMMKYCEDSIDEQQETMEEILSIYQDVNSVATTSGEILLGLNKVYRFTPTGDIAFVLPTVTGGDVGKFNQIYIQLNFTTVYNIDFGTTWGFNDTEPAINTAGKYNILYEYDGSNWVVGIIKRSEVV